MKTRRHIKHKKSTKKSRKAGAASTHHKTIPELRRAFEAIEAFARRKPTAKEFQSRWMRAFGKPISAKAAEEYIAFMSKQKQRGGQAPVGYEMRPGQATTPDGAYQNYVSKGFFIAEPANINCSTTQKGAGRQRGASRQRGAGLQNPAATAAAFISHPYSAQNPPTYAHLATKSFYGQDVPMTSDITKMTPGYQSMNPTIIPSIVTPLDYTTSGRTGSP
jgi:hypothetical protein